METNEHLQSATDLHSLIVGSTSSRGWSIATDGAADPPTWQRDAMAKILALTFDQHIEYLSTAMPDGQDWEIVAFTEATVVRVAVVRDGDEVSRTESFAFPRSSLESLELLDIAPIPLDDGAWPADLNMVGHYRAATINLPLDKFASPNNKSDLARFLSSLLQDLSHQ